MFSLFHSFRMTRTVKNLCSSLTSLREFLLSFPAETEPWHFPPEQNCSVFLNGHKDISLGYQKVIFLILLLFSLLQIYA